MTLADLQIQIGVNGAQQAITQINQVGAAAQGVGGGGTGGGGIGGMNGSLLGMVASIGAAVYGVRQLAQGFLAVSGIGVAAKYADIAAQIQTVTGNAASARAVLEQFANIGMKTAFDTAEVANFGMALLNTGTSVRNVAGELTNLLNLGAGTGLQRSVLPRFMINLAQLRSGTANSRDMGEMMRQAQGIGRVLGKQLGLGRTATREDLMGEYKQRGGEGFYQMLQGAGSSPEMQGMAVKLGLQSPTAAFANMMESIERIMLSSGDKMLGALMPVGVMVTNVAASLGQFNTMTGGFAGIAVIGAVMLRLRSAFLSVPATIDNLTLSIQRLGIAAGGAGGNIGPGGVGGRGGKAGFWRGVGNAAKDAAPYALGIGLQQYGATHTGRLAEASEAIGTGTITGAAIGDIIPFIGKPIGAAIGAAVGAVAFNVDTLTHGNRTSRERAADALKNGGTPADRAAKALERAAASLEKVSIDFIGGGRRARTSGSALEAEMAFLRLNSTGIA